MANRALILAAGRGTRMRSSLAKVLHPLCGRTLVGWGVEAAREAGCEVAVVVGHQRERVIEELDECEVVVQDPPQGTGDALRCAARSLPAEGVLLVMPGDAPLLRPETLRALLDGHGDALCSVLTSHITEAEAPTSGYGRIIRDASNRVRAIVEVAGACEEQLKVLEVNTGVYAFDAKWLFEEVVPKLQPHPPKGEYYLTDAIEHAANAGALNAVIHDDLNEVTGINDRAALSEATATAQARIQHQWMMEGVTIESPATTAIDVTVTLASDVTLEPGVVLKGDTTIEEGVTIEAHSRIEGAHIKAGARILAGSVVNGAIVEGGANVGPMARLRPGSVVGEGAKVGNFVEMKNSTLEAGAKASHLSYIGDAYVERDANIGAGTITCNYDGHGKHKTVIGKGAFIGSNSALVAPVMIGAGAIVGAGSTITRDVEPNSLAIGRARQVEKIDAAPDIHATNAARAARAKREKQ